MAGDSYMRSDRDLLHYAVRNIGYLIKRRGARWSAVGDLLGVGSTSAIAICKRFNPDPHEQIGPAKSDEGEE